MQLGLDIRDDYHRGCKYQAGEMVKAATLAEESGFESIWMNEDKGRDTLTLFGAMSVVTKKVNFGTSISNIYTRTPTQMAMAYSTLDELTNGRVIIGLGSGHHWSIEIGHGLKLRDRLPRMREYVEIIRKIVSRKQAIYNGKYFSGINYKLQFDGPRTEIPVYIAGSGPKMIQLAGEIGDGLIVNVITTGQIAGYITENLKIGADRAGKSLDKFNLTSVLTCIVSDNGADAVKLAKRILVLRYGHNAAHQELFREAGYEKETDAIVKYEALGREEEAIPLISDEMAISFVNAGTPQQVMKRLDDYYAAGAKRLALAPYPYGMENLTALCNVVKRYTK